MSVLQTDAFSIFLKNRLFFEAKKLFCRYLNVKIPRLEHNTLYMNNFIVPIDFSETSKNAARYAAHISSLAPDVHLILYNVFDSLEYGSDSSPLGTEAEEDAGRHAIMELALESVKREISGITSARITLVAEESNRF